MRKKTKKLGSLSGTTLGVRQEMGDISLTDISVQSLGGALASLNPISVMGAAATGFMQGVGSSSVAEA